MPAASKKSKVRICIWLPADLHGRLEHAAEVDDRTMSSFMIAALRRSLDEFEAAKKK